LLERKYFGFQNQKIGIVFGQEGRRPAQQRERWDTGECFIGLFGEKKTAENIKKGGNFFALNAECKHAFIRRGGEADAKVLSQARQDPSPGSWWKAPMPG
jgi:hypothetical protein